MIWSLLIFMTSAWRHTGKWSILYRQWLEVLLQSKFWSQETHFGWWSSRSLIGRQTGRRRRLVTEIRRIWPRVRIQTRTECRLSFRSWRMLQIVIVRWTFGRHIGIILKILINLMTHKIWLSDDSYLRKFQRCVLKYQTNYKRDWTQLDRIEFCPIRVQSEQQGWDLGFGGSIFKDNSKFLVFQFGQNTCEVNIWLEYIQHRLWQWMATKHRNSRHGMFTYFCCCLYLLSELLTFVPWLPAAPPPTSAFEDPGVLAWAGPPAPPPVPPT